MARDIEQRRPPSLAECASALPPLAPLDRQALMVGRRATSATQAPGAKASFRISSRSSSLQRRRRSGPENTVIVSGA